MLEPSEPLPRVLRGVEFLSAMYLQFPLNKRESYGLMRRNEDDTSWVCGIVRTYEQQRRFLHGQIFAHRAGVGHGRPSTR
jgi:hypothetical protein